MRDYVKVGDLKIRLLEIESISEPIEPLELLSLLDEFDYLLLNYQIYITYGLCDDDDIPKPQYKVIMPEF